MVYIFYAIAIIVPNLAVLVRRLHDVGRSGTYLLICLIPVIGCILLLIELCTEGNHGANKYGEDPKANHYELENIDK